MKVQAWVLFGVVKSLVANVTYNSFRITSELFIADRTVLAFALVGIHKTLRHQIECLVDIRYIKLFIFRFRKEFLFQNIFYEPYRRSSLDLNHSLCVVNMDCGTGTIAGQ